MLVSELGPGIVQPDIRMDTRSNFPPTQECSRFASRRSSDFSRYDDTQQPPSRSQLAKRRRTIQASPASRGYPKDTTGTSYGHGSLLSQILSGLPCSHCKAPCQYKRFCANFCAINHIIFETANFAVAPKINEDPNWKRWMGQAALRLHECCHFF